MACDDVTKPYVSLFMKQTFITNVNFFKSFYESFLLNVPFSHNGYMKFNLKKQSPEIGFLCLNCRSLKNCFENLDFLINESMLSLDIIALTETWLDGINDNLFTLDNFFSIVLIDLVKGEEV